MSIISVECCPICGACERVFLFTGYDRLHGLPGRFPVVRCEACLTAYLSERPVDLAAYYPDSSYAAFGGERHFSRAPGRRYGLAQRQRLLNTLKSMGGTLLDVGSGAGDFLALMHSDGKWHVQGLEPNAHAVRYACETRGLKVMQGELPAPAVPDAYYDVITMWHVLEHVPDAGLVLRDVRRILKPDGWLVVGVPLADSWEADHFKECWAGYDVPRHLVTFTRKSLIDFMARAGFQAREQRGVVQSFASLRLSLNFRMQAKDGRLKRGQHILSLIALAPLFLYMRLRSGRRLSVGVFVASPHTAGMTGSPGRLR